MPQHLVPPESIRGDRFVIEGPEAHHLIRVLRRGPGDRIELFDGVGGRYLGQIDGVSPDAPSVSGLIVAREPAQRPECPVFLFQGLARATKLDYVIEKAVELGAAGVIGFESSHSVVKISDAQAGPKRERWRRVAAAAAKQCGRSSLPSIQGPVPFAELRQRTADGGLTIVLSERESQISMKDALRSGGRPACVNLIVGPEGGFSPPELALLEEWGAVPATLGQRTLRTETAGLAALSIVNYEFDL